MNRRAFVQLIGAGVAGVALDPERLLWRPGAKTIFMPSDVRYHLGVNKGGMIGIGPRLTRSEYRALLGTTHLWTFEPMFTSLRTGTYRLEYQHDPSTRVWSTRLPNV